MEDKVQGKTKVHWGKLNQKTPLVFTDGSAFYKKLAKKYKTHRVGYFILTPSGAGKTYFIERQKNKDWLDGDELWEGANAHPKGPWWLLPLADLIEIEQKSDVITQQAKKLGFWILGSVNNWLKPDAIVLPHWTQHKKYIAKRQAESYDGGATTDMFAQVLHHRKWIKQWTRQGVPLFESVDEATNFLARKKN
ncbi:MAG: hypothetical protein WCV69_02130 [Patescibacteria group bacterium]|jgi:hypothetical protein